MSCLGGNKLNNAYQYSQFTYFWIFCLFITANVLRDSRELTLSKLRNPEQMRQVVPLVYKTTYDHTLKLFYIMKVIKIKA